MGRHPHFTVRDFSTELAERSLTLRLAPVLGHPNAGRRPQDSAGHRLTVENAQLLRTDPGSWGTDPGRPVGDAPRVAAAQGRIHLLSSGWAATTIDTPEGDIVSDRDRRHTCAVSRNTADLVCAADTYSGASRPMAAMGAADGRTRGAGYGNNPPSPQPTVD
jgi:hypothetical protein